MRALLIYNPNSGHHSIRKKLSYIERELSPCFDELEIKESYSPEHFEELIFEGCRYDVIIISGGDGSVNMAVNILSRIEGRPIVAFIPLGTINDAVRNFGLPTRFKSSIKAIKSRKINPVDVIQVNDRYVSYVATVGAYSDLPYVVGNKEKKIWGKFAYYFHAIPRLFIKKRVKGTLFFNNKEVEFTTPFLLILNGKRMGGFTINKSASNSDGYLDVIYAKPSMFNSLLTYFFAKKRLIKYRVDKVKIHLESDELWELDGERGMKGDVNVEVKHNHLLILGK